MGCKVFSNRKDALVYFFEQRAHGEAYFAVIQHPEEKQNGR